MGKLRNDELELDYDAGGGKNRSRSIELSDGFVQNGSWEHYDNSGPTNSKSLSNGRLGLNVLFLGTEFKII